MEKIRFINCHSSGSQSLTFFNNVEHQIGERGYDGSGTYFIGYMEINVIQGQLLDASHFIIEFQTNIWRPKRYSELRWFHLDFSDNSN